VWATLATRRPVICYPNASRAFRPQEVRENIKDLGDSVGHMASRQYERAQDVATDAIQETGDAIQRNPLTAIGIGFGVGFIFGLAMGGRR
ncbi:MAG: hypothetical protein WBZ27_07780, partial [Pseudolabrys sp.]